MVFDTMVVAYAVLGVSGFAEDCQKAVQRAREIVVPDVFRAELVNVVWQWVVQDHMSVEAGREALQDAQDFLTRVVGADKLWEQALELAVAKKHPAYDMLFVALAIQTGSRLVTYDRRVQKLFPEYVISVPEFLRS